MTNPKKNSQFRFEDLARTDQVYEQLQQKARYLQIVNELALALLKVSSLDEILWVVAKSAIAQLGFEDCVIYLLDANGNTLIQRAAHGPKNPEGQQIFNPITIPVGKGIVGTVAVSGVGELVADVRLDERYIIDDEPRLSELAVPIIYDDKVIGVIDSEHHQAGFYTTEHLEILTTIASIASTKIAGALTIEHLNEAIEKLELANKQLKDAKAALHQSEKRYRNLYDHHPSMIFTLTDQGKIHSANHFTVEQLGYSIVELADMPFANLHGAIEADNIESHITTCLRDVDKLHHWEASVKRKDGSYIWVRETARAVVFNKNENEAILVIIEDITETRNLSKKLMYQASHDSLTGLCNRREFEHRLEQALELAKTDQIEHAVCYLDLDMFKVINDTCGHVAGDELLRQLGSLFLEKLRKSDTVARLGGDEFGVLLHHCSLPKALELTESLRKAVEIYRFQWQEKIFSIGISIGLVVVNRDSDNVTAILSSADSACYAAKEAGHNQMRVYREDDTLLQQRHREMRWIARINKAFEENRFHLYYQQIVPIHSNAIEQTHYEILLRMEDEMGKIISPRSFLPAAERYGFAQKLDCWVIKHTLSWLVQHPLHLAKLNLCSINLSGHSISDQEVLDFVTKTLRESGIAPEKICLEITETAAIANMAKASAFMNTLKAMGCRFALDDFGSGLSSFAYLKNLPVDYLKIDGVFIKDINDDPVDLAIVRSIKDISQMMDTQTIAEFVECEAVMNTLIEVGIDYAQGYHVSMPQPLAKMPNAEVELLTHHRSR